MPFYAEHLSSAAFFGAVSAGTLWYGKKQGFFSLPKKSKHIFISLENLCSAFGIYLISMLVLPFGLIALARHNLFPPFLVQPVAMLLCFFFSVYCKEFCCQKATKNFVTPLSAR